MASHPDNHPDSTPDEPSRAPDQVTPGDGEEHENVEEHSPADDAGFQRDDGGDALA